MADYSDYYNSWCSRCGREIGFSTRHAPWCGKMDEAAWWKETFQKSFEELSFNLLTVEPLYECKVCYAVARDWKNHYRTQHLS